MEIGVKHISKPFGQELEAGSFSNPAGTGVESQVMTGPRHCSHGWVDQQERWRRGLGREMSVPIDGQAATRVPIHWAYLKNTFA